MEYNNIWQKILKPEEKVIKEFSLGRKYILLIQTVDGLLGLLFLPFNIINSRSLSQTKEKSKEAWTKRPKDNDAHASDTQE